jgi:protein-disulfide isomerase
MNFRRILSIAALCAGITGAGLLATAPSSAQDSKKPFDATQTEAIQGIVRDYLVKNPEVIRDAINELNKRQQVAAEAERKTVLTSLYKDETPFSAGKGKVTLVEFFDYNCGYCKRAFKNIVKLMEKDKDLRVVFVELPILSEESKEASLAAIAAAKQNKYFEFHQGLMLAPGAVDKDKIYKVAKEIGLDVDKLKADMKSPEVVKQIEKNLKISSAMGLQGTPAFFIGDEMIPGAPDNLAQLISTAAAKVRKSGCAAC